MFYVKPPYSIPPVLLPFAGAGAPVIAHSTGAYPAGTNVDGSTPSPKRGKGLGGLKRSLTMGASPQNSPKMRRNSSFFQDAQNPNGTPVREEDSQRLPPTPVTPVTRAAEPSEATAAPTPRGSAPDSAVMPPPPVPTGPEQKDSLFWKFFS